MIFRQLFEPSSSTYSYLLACPDTGESVLIDPVLETVWRDLEVMNELGLKLTYTLETHIHADHLTGARKLKHLSDCKTAAPAMDQLPCADVGIREGESFKVGHIELHPLFTPGHTATHHAYVFDNGTQRMLFSGDALLIDGCGRTDFQGGDASTLFRSIHEKLFTLPAETLVYPAHDYACRTVSTIGQETKRNPRLSDGKTEEEFVAIMAALNLSYPAKMDFAVPGNLRCGECPPNVPDALREPCEFGEV